MPRTRKEEWIGIKEATKIISENAGREISDAYVRLLGKQGKIGMKPMDGRTNLYRKGDCEGYTVKVRDQGKGRGKTTQQQKEKAVA